MDLWDKLVIIVHVRANHIQPKTSVKGHGREDFLSVFPCLTPSTNGGEV
jgi:hypothetical protein